jgi:RNA polymerase sigma factor (sigma-70 family)
LTPFRPLPDHELDLLADDELIGYVRDARAAGEPAAAQRALAILVFGHWRNVERRVGLKVPAHHVEDLTGDIIAAAIESAFDGVSVGEFVNWLKTITARKVADHFRRGTGSHPATASLGRSDEDDSPGIDPEAPDERGLVEAQDAIERVLSRRNDVHCDVIERVVFEGLPAREAGEPSGLSEANVHQIVSRFRRDLREDLDT